VDGATVERLVRSLIVDFGLPYQLIGAERSNGLWEVTILDAQRRVRRFALHDSAPASMRASAKAQLDAWMED